jgi:hypothetical protein
VVELVLAVLQEEMVLREQIVVVVLLAEVVAIMVVVAEVGILTQDVEEVMVDQVQFVLFGQDVPVNFHQLV